MSESIIDEAIDPKSDISRFSRDKRDTLGKSYKSMSEEIEEDIQPMADQSEDSGFGFIDIEKKQPHITNTKPSPLVQPQSVLKTSQLQQSQNRLATSQVSPNQTKKQKTKFLNAENSSDSEIKEDIDLAQSAYKSQASQARKVAMKYISKQGLPGTVREALSVYIESINPESDWGPKEEKLAQVAYREIEELVRERDLMNKIHDLAQKKVKEILAERAKVAAGVHGMVDTIGVGMGIKNMAMVSAGMAPPSPSLYSNNPIVQERRTQSQAIVDKERNTVYQEKLQKLAQIEQQLIQREKELKRKEHELLDKLYPIQQVENSADNAGHKLPDVAIFNALEQKVRTGYELITKEEIPEWKLKETMQDRLSIIDQNIERKIHEDHIKKMEQLRREEMQLKERIELAMQRQKQLEKNTVEAIITEELELEKALEAAAIAAAYSDQAVRRNVSSSTESPAAFPSPKGPSRRDELSREKERVKTKESVRDQFGSNSERNLVQEMDELDKEIEEHQSSNIRPKLSPRTARRDQFSNNASRVPESAMKFSNALIESGGKSDNINSVSVISDYPANEESLKSISWMSDPLVSASSMAKGYGQNQAPAPIATQSNSKNLPSLGPTSKLPGLGGRKW